MSLTILKLFKPVSFLNKRFCNLHMEWTQLCRCSKSREDLNACPQAARKILQSLTKRYTPYASSKEWQSCSGFELWVRHIFARVKKRIAP